MSRMIASWFVLVLCLVGFGCHSAEEIERGSSELSTNPAGQQPSVLDNPMHTKHLAGTTPLECTSCHQIQAASFDAPKAAVCVGCHQDNKVALHADAVDCKTCHVFAAGKAQSPIACQQCHEQPQGDTFAIAAHAKVDCRNCHVPHGEPQLAVRNCLDCHDDHQQNHGKAGLGTIERCSQCHTPHSKSLEAVTRCQGCHKEKLVRAVFRGHDKCDTCHQGDARSAPTKPLACVQCHKARITLAASAVPSHAACKNCHAPHDPRGTAVQSCRRCHSELTPKHPAPTKGGSCLGCHTAHPKSKETVVLACTSCHRQARADDMLHAPKKVECVQCHRPHDFNAPNCQSCHERQTAQTMSASGHKVCSACHTTPHTPKVTAGACATCHVAEYESANPGHKACASCHQPHSGNRLPTARCSNCHKEKLAMIHGRIDGGCASCHRPHGPRGKARPPTCKSCHKKNDLPSLHAVEAHNSCSTCHEGHRMPELNRATCIGRCHADRVDHEPVAKTCVGCHPFGASR